MDGAEDDELDDLLERKPYCFGGADGVTVIRCSETAQRTARSGVYELQARATLTRSASY